MRRPFASTSLRARVVTASLVVLAVALIGAGASIYLVQHVTLERHLQEVLAERVELVRDYAHTWTDPEELTEALSRRGIRVEVRTEDGRRLISDPRFPRIGSNLPLPPGTSDPTLLTNTIALPSGGQATVAVSRDGVDTTLARLLRLKLLTAAIALPLAAGLLLHVSRRALHPLDQLTQTANDIAAGDLTRRVSPTTTSTELGRTGAAFDHMLDELARAVDRAEASAQLTRDFLGLTAHQLKTPIASASASVQALLRATTFEQREELLLAASRETDRAARMVHALLRLAHLDQGLAPTILDTDLSQLVREEHARAARRAPHLNVHLDVPERLPAAADPNLTAEILANLLDNATRHAVSTVTLTAQAKVDVVTIAVGDDGPGPAPADRARIFDRFVSVGDHGGTGLGLPIARGLAHAQNGDLFLVANRFQLSLPRPETQNPLTPDPASSFGHHVN